MERTLDLMAAFKSNTSDSTWWKKLIWMALSLLFVPIAMGYMFRSARQAAQQPEAPLPEFSDIWGLLVDGIKVCVVQLVYTFPGLFIMIVGLFVGGGLSAMVGGDNAAAGGMVIGLVCSLAGIIVACVGAFLFFGAFVNMMDPNNPWTVGFDFMSAKGLMMENMGLVVKFFVLCFVVNLITNVVGGLVGSIIPVVGALVASAFGMMVTAKLYGQFARCLRPNVFE